MTTESRILEIARSVRPDAWVDFASANAWRVGFRSGPAEEANAYNLAASQVADLLQQHGFKVRLRTGDESWPYAVLTVRE